MTLLPFILRRAAAALLLAAAGSGQAAVDTFVLAPVGEDEPVTVFQPANAPANGRLVVLSHGSGGSPRVHMELVEALVDAGFVVAAPLHRRDNFREGGGRGPEAFERRPGEVSRAIDAVLADPRFAGRLDAARVGVYGMSAGGHTALSMAGGRWSAARLRDHCAEHLVDDWNFCTGLNLRLTGGPLDGAKQWLVRLVHRIGLGDETPHEHRDPRIAAVAAAVPVAADFDPASLAEPPMPLALLTAAQDRWLVSRFHAERVLAACARCEHLADPAQAGHGAYLGPLPPRLDGLIGEMLNDPPGFDRGAMPAVNRAVADFFRRHLL